jgi:hypothetical protein
MVLGWVDDSGGAMSSAIETGSFNDMLGGSPTSGIAENSKAIPEPQHLFVTWRELPENLC